MDYDVHLVVKVFCVNGLVWFKKYVPVLTLMSQVWFGV